jgi:PTS system mannose-specific IIA component
MIGALVVSHGHLAQELLAAAEMIVGEISHMQAVSIGWHDDVNEARSEIERRISDVDSGAGVLLLTDMFGGTPSNISLAFLSEAVEVVSGVNLSMVIKFANHREEKPLLELARLVQDAAQKSIVIASQMLKGKR